MGNAKSAVNGWFDIVADYGAVPGTTGDPTANYNAINLALTDMVNPTKNPTKTGVLYIPPGEFKVAGTFTVPSGIMVRGAGTTVSTISETLRATDVFQTAGGAAGVTFVGLKVHFTNPNTQSQQNGIALSLRGASEAKIIDVLVDVPGTAFQIGGVSNGCSGVYVARTNTSCTVYTNYGLNVPGFQSSELHFTGV